MPNTTEIKKSIHKDLLLIILIAAISIITVVAVWRHYVEDIKQLEERINQSSNKSNI